MNALKASGSTTDAAYAAFALSRLKNLLSSPIPSLSNKPVNAPEILPTAPKDFSCAFARS